MQKEFALKYQLLESDEELSADDLYMLSEARKITASAYAPYSKFLVGAFAKLSNGGFVTGTNQENASYPVGICAERVLLSAASSLHTNVPIETIAISYHNTNGKSAHPISPCGICRQSLLEYEERGGKPIRLILAGLEGKIIILNSATFLLPLSFGSTDLL